MNARRDEIIELRKSGLSYAKIGRRFGISRERVRQIFKGETTREKPDLRSKTMLRVGEVASLLGLHVITVRRWEKGTCKPSPLALLRIDELTKEMNGEPL